MASPKHPGVLRRSTRDIQSLLCDMNRPSHRGQSRNPHVVPNVEVTGARLRTEDQGAMLHARPGRPPCYTSASSRQIVIRCYANRNPAAADNQKKEES